MSKSGVSATGEKLTRVAIFVDKRIEELKGVKSQRDISIQAGYKNQNMITMIKQGKSKVSLDRASDLARALEVDPKEFIKIAFAQFYSPEVIKKLFDDLGVR